MSKVSRSFAYVGFRCPKGLKEKLVWSGAQAGRSLSTEVQFRLERSLREEGLREQMAKLEDLVMAKLSGPPLFVVNDEGWIVPNPKLKLGEDGDG